MDQAPDIGLDREPRLHEVARVVAEPAQHLVQAVHLRRTGIKKYGYPSTGMANPIQPGAVTRLCVL